MNKLLVEIDKDQFDQLLVERLKEAYNDLASMSFKHLREEDSNDIKETLGAMEKVVMHFSVLKDYDNWIKSTKKDNTSGNNWSITGNSDSWSVSKD